MTVSIVPTGVANIASVMAGFRRAGANPTVIGDPREVALARRVVVPGVGSFGAASRSVEESGVRNALVERLETGRPTMLVCVGMQLLCEGSEEDSGASGLGIIPGAIKRFRGDIPVPQLGWNQITASPDSRFVTSGWAYFANSYRLVDTPVGWVGAVANYGGQFVAGLERGDILACQFHPELSGEWGAGILERWLDATGATGRW